MGQRWFILGWIRRWRLDVIWPWLDVWRLPIRLRFLELRRVQLFPDVGHEHVRGVGPRPRCEYLALQRILQPILCNRNGRPDGPDYGDLRLFATNQRDERARG